ncbi:MAG: HD domain-containing protein [Candidatus Dadabacteria bacterium]|nr:MAG: HD domain-containing protein [Candidatus Dadabacteria bacterium]
MNFSPSQAEIDLFATEEISRLHQITTNASMQFTLRGRNLSDTRFEHSLAVAADAGRIAEQLGFDQREAQLVRIAGLLHDVAHPPFAHSGEYGISTFNNGFDHDHEGLYRIATNGIAEALLNNGIHPVEIIAILATNSEEQADNFNVEKVLIEAGYSEEEVKNALSKLPDQERLEALNFIVKEAADRPAYVRMDSAKTNILPEFKERIANFTRRFQNSISSQNGKIVVSDLEAARAVLAARRLLYQEYAQHPAGTVTDEVLIRAVRTAIKSGAVTEEEFVQMTDAEAFKLFKPHYQRWLSNGIEESFEPVAAFRLSDLNEEGRKIVERKAFRRMVRNYVADYIPKDHIVVGVTRDYSKHEKVNTTRDGTVKTFSLDCSIPDTHRFLTIAVSKDIPEKVRERVKQDLSEFLKQYLKNDAQNLRAVIFDNIDDSFFNAA